MGLFDRFRKRQKPGTLRGSSNDDTGHLVAWAKQRRGVEAYVEPKTTVTETTVVLIAHDGEWTRRRVDGPEGARKLGKKLGIPVYDVALVGYPKRMRDYTERQRALRKRAQRDDLT
ncbi:oxidoreductase [Allokutzneria sp. NRRL B-24872]|uniref:oxidoreductase n=1 Tax=Allokutzneria sp. NRRL B-24872 TaxID=1137961 RepID=UPI000A374D45|nr:oxidoreductase [Allokutzneria sp. NRRL B-24872]